MTTVSLSETYAEQEVVLLQLILLGEATYVWAGAEDSRLDTLSVAVPSPYSQVPPGTTLLGSSADGASQTMAQRLTRKLGRPVFVSLNVREDPDLHFFVQQRVLRALAEAAEEGPPSQAPPSLLPLPAAAQARIAAAAHATPMPVDHTSALALPAVGVMPEDSAAGARTFSVYESGEPLALAACQMLLGAAEQAIAARGAFYIALSGGSIPTLLSPPLLANKERAHFDKW